MASPAISNNLGASIVIARLQRRERMECCDDYIRIHEEKLLLYAMEELRIEAWGEPWNDGPPTGHRLLDGGQWGIRGFEWEAQRLPPIAIYSYYDICLHV